ncbi:unnamed protein product, partial [Amoebophrya sp. A25]
TNKGSTGSRTTSSRSSRTGGSMRMNIETLFAELLQRQGHQNITLKSDFLILKEEPHQQAQHHQLQTTHSTREAKTTYWPDGYSKSLQLAATIFFPNVLLGGVDKDRSSLVVAGQREELSEDLLSPFRPESRDDMELDVAADFTSAQQQRAMMREALSRTSSSTTRSSSPSTTTSSLSGTSIIKHVPVIAFAEFG